MTPGMVPGTVQPGTTITPMPGVPTGPTPGAPMTSSSVSAKDNVFDPATITVQPGTTVRWVNNGQHPHTVTARDGSFDSGNIAPGGSFTHTFSTAGAVRYYCKLHKGMEGTVVVGEPKKMPAGGGGGTPAKGPSY